MNELGLRERSKMRRHAAIANTAMRLFGERGYDATTVAEIAAEVEVAPRTVSLYFPTKLDLAMSFSEAAAQRLIDAFQSQTSQDSAFDVVRRWLHDEWLHNAEPFRLHRAMLATNPALRGMQSQTTRRASEVTMAAIAADVGRTGTDINVAILAGVLGGIIEVLHDLDPETADAVEALDIAERVMNSAMAVVRTHRSPTADPMNMTTA